MILQLRYFGMIAEAIEKEAESFDFSDTTIEELNTALKNSYPQLKKLNYSFAINQTISNKNETLKPNDEIALLPPFAGG